jgi:phosphoribosylanthranilate isomerase
MTRVKICGLTNLEDALAAAEAGSDLLGFNFHKESPRYIEPGSCRAITAVIRQHFPAIMLVGVFVNEPVTGIRQILKFSDLDLAQLHGDEAAETLATLAPQAFKAMRPRLEARVEEAPAILDEVRAFAAMRGGVAPAVLIDAAVTGQYGGSGQLADWTLARAISSEMPMLLAGGLRPENVGAAVREVTPWGVDVASGVESSPGCKDRERMRAFIGEVRRLDRRPGTQPLSGSGRSA